MAIDKSETQDKKYEDGKNELYENELKRGYDNSDEAAKAFFERYYSYTLKTKMESETEFVEGYGLELGTRIYSENGRYFYREATIGHYATKADASKGLGGGGVNVSIGYDRNEILLHTHPNLNNPKR